MKPGRVILTYGRSLMSLVIARSLAHRGVEVIGCDDVDLTVLQFSKHVKDYFVHPPIREPQAFLEFMEHRVLEYAPDDDRPYILMPVFRETNLIASHKDWFEPTITVATPDTDSLALVDPKNALARTAKDIGLDIPETRIIDSEADLKSVGDTLTFPVLIKPSVGVGGRGIEKIESAAHLERYTRAHADDLVYPYLLQDLADGEDYCCPIIAQDGQIVAMSAYRNVLRFPKKAGAGAVREAVPHEPFRKTAERLVAYSRWNGIAQLDFRWDGTNSPKLIEVNARFWAGLFHSVVAGIDFPWSLYQLFAFNDVSPPDQTTSSTVTKSPAVWLPALLEDIVHSEVAFDELAKAWEGGADHLADGRVKTAFAHVLDQFKSKTGSMADVFEALQDEMSKLKNAPSELSNSDDPFVGLGILFVIGSLYRHHKLPPEITYKEDHDPPHPRAKEVSGRGKPVIGITRPENGDWLAYQAIRFAIWLAGGDPLPLTARAPRDPHLIDGLVFGGGSDIFPERFGALPKDAYTYDHNRDDMELTWNTAARDHAIPVLGICRGAQMMNVAAGGTLHLDLSAYENANYPTHAFHQIFYRKKVSVEEHSVLHRLTGRHTLSVNSIHSQAIETVGNGFHVTARETNGVIQAVEDPERAFAVGVQFHPEFLIYRGCFRRLFKGFVKAAHERRRAKLSQS